MILTRETVGQPCRVFDARGVEIKKPVFVDTRTGLVGRYWLDECGDVAVDPDTTEVIKVFELWPVPISVTFLQRSLRHE